MAFARLFETINKIIIEIDTFFPYKVIRVEHAEGDDVIAVLSKTFKEKSLIVSSDKDFSQLYKYKWIRQFSPMKQKMLNGIDPIMYLKEHIIRGDKGDGIPNILSEDDCIVSGVRQKSISKKKIINWLVQDPHDFNDEMKRGWIRNKILIDFDLIPEPITTAILKQYNEEKKYQQGQLINYFIKNRLKYLMENMGDFTK